MIARITGAAMRALLVALLVVTPSLMLPRGGADNPHMVVLIGLLAAVLTFVEYCARSPSIVEFRDAAPFNRLRFLMLFATIFALCVICRDAVEPTPLTEAIAARATIVSDAVDQLPLPVGLAVLMLPDDAGQALVTTARTAASIAFLMSLAMLAMFVVLVRAMGWPGRGCAFNVWINLPLFSPASGGDVLDQLRRDSRFNIWFGLLLGVLIPAVVKLATFLVHTITLENPQTLIWTITAWAFLPASMIMRGLALGRIAGMIEAKRRRVHAAGPKAAPQPA